MPKEQNKASVDEQAIRDQAADWMVRLAEREMSYVEHLRYLEWLRRSPVHFEEMVSALRLRGKLSDPRLWTGLRNVHEMQKPCRHGCKVRCHPGARS